MKYKQTSMSKTLFLLLMLSVPITLQFCTSGRIAKGIKEDKKAEPGISYSKHILPIMTEKCTPCHFPDRGRKKMLNTYEATRDNIEDILYRVQLPVNHEDYMPFKSKREPLTVAEINLIKDWVAQEMNE